MANVTWSYVSEPYHRAYGVWELNNPNCYENERLETHQTTRLIQLLFATMCFCQVIFMSTRAPRVTWEAVFLPLVESILYSLSASGHGTLRMGDGRVFPFSRMASWLVTCPLMLFQANAINKVKVKGIAMKNMMMAASIVRTVNGMAASITTNQETKWAFYGMGWFFLLFEFQAIWRVFEGGLKKFSDVKTPTNNLVHSRLVIMRLLFFTSWSAFPVIWLLSATGLCWISEDTAALCYLAADALCKNLYGLIQTNTVWGVLDGKWKPETMTDAQKPHEDHSHETWLNHMMGMSYSKQRHDASAAAPERLHSHSLPPRDPPSRPMTQFSSRHGRHHDGREEARLEDGDSDSDRSPSPSPSPSPRERGERERRGRSRGRASVRSESETEVDSEEEQREQRRRRSHKRAGSTRSQRSKSSRRSRRSRHADADDLERDLDRKRGAEPDQRVQDWRERHPQEAPPHLHHNLIPPLRRPAPQPPLLRLQQPPYPRRAMPGRSRSVSNEPRDHGPRADADVDERRYSDPAARASLPPERQSDTTSGATSWLSWLRLKPASDSPAGAADERTMSVAPGPAMPLRNSPTRAGAGVCSDDPSEGSLRSLRGAWQENAEARECNKCKAPFSLLRRRHHCRNCGLVFCMACSNKLCTLPQIDAHRPQRVCTDCYQNVGGHLSQGRAASGDPLIQNKGRDRPSLERRLSRA